MNKELEKKLVETFPKLYRQYHLTIQESCMPWGFECPDEWFDAIWELSKRVTQLMDMTGIVIEACQVKEKFGSLRFYYDIKTEKEFDYNYLNDIIVDAERKVHEIEEKNNVRRTS